MFDSNQSIMLMGTAVSTDVSLHLSNAEAELCSELNSANPEAVYICF